MIVSAAAIVGAWALAPSTDAASRNDTSSRRALPLTRTFPSSYAAQTPVTGQTVTVYGPQQFKRTAGAPNVFTATILVPAGVGAPFTLKVQNGDAAGGYRVTAADLEVNGVGVAVPSTFNNATSGFDAPVALGGSNTLRVTLRGAPASYLTLSIEGRTLDRTPPRLTVIAPPPDAVISTTTPQLVIGYADPASDGGPSGIDVTSLNVQVDGLDRTSLFTRGAEQATAQLTAAQAVVDGPHVVVASIADRAGNVGSATARFVVDRTAPSIETIEPPPGRFVNTTTPTIRVQYQDRDGVDLSTLRVLVNGVDRTALFTRGATEAVATLDAASALPQGMVEVASTIRDVGGNAASSTSSFVVDTEMPAIEIVQPGLDQYTSAAVIDVSGSITDASPATVTVNGVDASVSGSSFMATNVPIGSGPDVEVVVLATDAAGNTARISRVVHVDRDAPAVHIDQPAAGAFVGSAAIAVSGTVADASAVVVRVNGVSATVGNGIFTATVPAADGPATLQAVAEDAAGNTAAFSVPVTVDTVTPQVTIATPAAGSVLRGPVVTVTGTVADATPTVVLVNGVPATISGSTFSAAVSVPDGAVTLAVVASDAAGNSATTAAAVTVDSVAPALRITAPAPGSSTNAAAVHITGTVDDATPVTLTVAGVTVPVVSSQFAYDAIVANDGDATIAAVATDAAGNTATASVTVTVDRSAPTVTIVTPASGSFLRGPSVAITGTVSDAAIASVDVNGIPAVVSGGAFTALVPVNDGAVTLVATATDRAGNSATAAASITVDTVSPAISVVLSPDGSTPARPQFVFTTTDNVAIDAASFSASVDGQPMLFTTSSSGPSQFTFVAVPAADLGDGDHTYSAVIADRCGNTAALAPQVYTVHLAPAGTIRGRLLAADGVTPVAGQVVTAAGPSVRSAVTAADGSFQFDREDLGTYTLTATLASGSRAKVDGVVLAANGDVVSVDLVAIAIGSVTVTVSTNDATPVSPSVVVTLHSLHPVFGFFASATPATGTTVTFTGVPVGDFTVAAADAVRLYRGDAGGTIARDGQSIAITVQMTNGVVTLPAALVDANNFQFGVQANGSVTGTNNAFSTGRFGALLDIVSGGVANRFGGAPTAQVEQNRRQLVVQQAAAIAGLAVTRKIFVPSDGYFSRYLEVLSNSTASPITVDVRVTSTMKAPNAQRAIATSSGDAVVSVADPANPDRWVVANDTQTSDPNLVTAGPALAFVFDGDGGARRVDNLTFTPDAVGQLVEQWSSVTVPAGGQAAFMHFVVMQMDAASARASAARLVTLPQEALAGLTAADIATIQNFAIPANAVSAVPALRLGGRVSGTVFGADSLAPVPAATVTFRSASPYYRRAYTVTTPANGAFSFTQTVGSAAANIAVPIDGFTLQATSGSIQSPPTSGAFPAAQTAALANVVFTNAGVIRGTVRRHTGLPATGFTTLYLLNGSTSITSLPASTYVLPVVAPGAFTLEAQTSHPQGSPLDGTRAGAIAVGESLTFDVILPPTGTVSGRTIVSGGAASPFGTVTITGANGFTRRTQADGNGFYTLSDVPVGVYTFSATQFSTNVAADSASIAVAVDAATMQDAVFPGKGTVTGTVLFADGTTIATGVQVALFGTGITSRSTSSNASGVYTFTDVPTGRPFTVRATSPSNPQLYRDGSASLSGDGQVLTLNIVLPASATVLVTVVTPLNPPAAVAGSSVTLVDAIGATSVGVSNVNGQVAFANVPEGSFAVTATDPAGRRGLATARGTITLANQGGTVSIQLVQPFIASVAGHVYGADGLTPIADARVSALVADRSVDAFSGPDGSYAIDNVSPDGGALTLRVDSPFTLAPIATRTVAIDSDGQQVLADFSLPYAAIRGLVTFADGRFVPSPSVTVTQVGPDGFPVNYNATSDDTGHYAFVGLVLGDFSVTAQDTATGLTGTTSARIDSLALGAEPGVALQPSGTVTGTVKNAAGVVAGATVNVTSTGLNLQRFTVTGADGGYRVDDVALGVVTVQSFVSPFTFVAQGELSSVDQVVTIDLAPPPAGTVTGTVRDAFGAPIVGALVFIEDALGTASTSTLTGDNGIYSATWLPGPVRVTALRTSDVLNAGVAETTVAPGATVTVDVALGNAVYAFARMPLPAADGFIYKVECDGSIAAGGTSDGRLPTPYSAKSYAMTIDGVAPGCRRSLLLEDNRQQVVAGPEADGQVTVTRKTFVPAAGSFVRMVDSVTNPTAADMTVTMVVTATLPSSTSTRVVVAPGPSTPYAVTDGGGKPALAHVFGGNGAAVSPSATHAVSGDSQLSYRWTVTIPAGQTISVMHFSAQRDVVDSAGATATAQALSALTVPDALAGLSNEERARIINFRVP